MNLISKKQLQLLLDYGDLCVHTFYNMGIAHLPQSAKLLKVNKLKM